MLVRLGFNVEEYKKKEAEKLKRKAEKDKIRAMYEKGVV
jgi:preprotein translocase subunit SecF